MSAPDLDAAARRIVRAIRSSPSEAAAVLVVRHYLRDALALREALRFVQEHPAYPADADARAPLPLALDDDEPSVGDVAEALAGGR